MDLGDLEGLPPPELFAPRVKSLVCVSTPNRGTGIASFFGGIMGAKLLALLSLFTVTVLRFGRVPLSLGFRIAGAIVRFDNVLGWKDTLVDQLFAQLLENFSAERRTSLATFLAQVSRDQSLISQLTPEGVDLFNASVQLREGVRYGSVITQARPPTLRTRLASGLDPYAQLTHNIYAFLYGKAKVPVPPPLEAHKEALIRGFGLPPSEVATDGIVPTLSQPWGDIVATAWADHLDIIGHFEGPTHAPPHIDWVISATGFRRAEFVEVWKKVADYVLAAA